MNEHAFSFLCCNFDKVKDVLCCFVIVIKQHLAFNVLPEEGQIDDAKALPLILDLLARTVDHPRHLVHLNEV